MDKGCDGGEKGAETGGFGGADTGEGCGGVAVEAGESNLVEVDDSYSS